MRVLLILALVLLSATHAQAQAFPGPVTVDFAVPQHVICDSGCSSAEGPVDVSDRAGRLVGQVTFATAQPVTFSNATIAVTNAGTFPVQAAQSGTWTVTGAGGTFPVTGTFWQATQPVSGTFWQATQPVSLASVPSHPVTNAGTFAVQVTSAPTTTVEGTIACSNCGGAVGTPFQCAITSTAVTSTSIANCGPPGANLTRYITDISYASSIIATTTNFLTLQFGTGTNCGTGTTVVWRMFNNAAFVPVIGHGLTQPIKLGTNTDLCFLHPGAGTRVLNVQGYIAAP